MAKALEKRENRRAIMKKASILSVVATSTDLSRKIPFVHSGMSSMAQTFIVGTRLKLSVQN